MSVGHWVELVAVERVDDGDGCSSIIDDIDVGLRDDGIWGDGVRGPVPVGQAPNLSGLLPIGRVRRRVSGCDLNSKSLKNLLETEGFQSDVIPLCGCGKLIRTS